MTIKGYGYIVTLLTASLLTACGNDIPSISTLKDAEEGKGVTLTLNIAMSEFPETEQTRAPFPDSDDMSFEGPVSDYEKMRTLRVIIVHGEGNETGIVEHNRMVTADLSSGAIINDNLRFKVTSGEKKDIYLFANEAATGHDFGSIAEGSVFPEEEIRDIRISRRSGAAFIDNGTSSVEKRFVPMSEMFEIDVPTPVGDSDFFQIEHLFVTRSTVKFSFHFSTPEDYPAQGASVTGIKLYGLADECYYLPRNTSYDPGKYTPAFDNGGGRYITSFDTPDGTSFSGYTFAPFSPIEIKEGMDAAMSPFIYFPESKREGGTKPFRISVVLDNGTEFLVPRNLSLDNIPRNTHVKINILMKSTDVDASVTLLPYTGVWLNPDFGL